jgi:hypothetical protein
MKVGGRLAQYSNLTTAQLWLRNQTIAVSAQRDKGKQNFRSFSLIFLSWFFIIVEKMLKAFKLAPNFFLLICIFLPILGALL